MDRERGLFVAFCGLKGSGKSTLLEPIQKQWQGVTEVSTVKHPPKEWREHPKILATFRDGEGDKISGEEEVKYITELRIKEQNEKIIPELYRGNMVFAHRYIFSMYSYYLSNPNVDIRKIFEVSKNVIMPDLTFYFRISPEEAVRRMKIRDNKVMKDYLNLEHVKGLVKGFDSLAKVFDFEVIENENIAVSEVMKKCVNKLSSTKPSSKLMTVGEKIASKDRESLDFVIRLQQQIRETIPVTKGIESENERQV